MAKKRAASKPARNLKDELEAAMRAKSEASAATSETTAQPVGVINERNGSIYDQLHSTKMANGHATVNGVPECITAASLVIREHAWLWPAYIPEGLMTLAAGDTGAGKSTVLVAIAAAVSAGREMSGRGGHPPGRVLFFAAEDDAAATVRPRLVVANAELNRVHMGGIGRDGRPLPRLQLPADIVKLTRQVKDMAIRLLVLDPITAYLGAGVDQNKDQAVGQVLDGLVQLADETGCTVICSKNYRKSREGGPLEWVGGAPKWTQVPRVVLAFGFDPDEPSKRVMACSKNSLTKDVRSQRYVIRDVDGVGQWNGGALCDLTAEDLGAGGMTPGDRDALADAQAFLIDALAAEEKPAKDISRIAEESAISRATLRRAKAKLGITSHPIGPNGQRYIVWRMPEKAPPAPPVGA